MATKSKKPTLAAAAAALEAADAPAEPAVMLPFPTVSLESLADLSRENFEAMTKANLALTEGLQAMGQEILTYARSSLESASQAATALLGAKTFDEVIQLNSDLARANLETMIARSARLSEMGVSIASGAFAPLGGRVEATFAKLTKAVAA